MFDTDDVVVDEITANRTKAVEALAVPEDDADEAASVAPEDSEEPSKEVLKKGPDADEDKDPEMDAKFAASFAALRKQKRHTDQLLASAKEEQRQVKAQRDALEGELSLVKLLREGTRNPASFFEAARLAGVPAEEMANFLTKEREPETHITRELQETKAELAQMKQYLTERQRQEIEYQQQHHAQQMGQAEAQIGEKFVGYLTENMDAFPALATQSEDDIRASAIYWAREEYKATGNLPSAERLATFLEHHALQKVSNTLAARRTQASPKPSQQARSANRSSGESLTNDDASEASISADEDSPEARRRRAVAVLAQNWRQL